MAFHLSNVHAGSAAGAGLVLSLTLLSGADGPPYLLADTSLRLMAPEQSRFCAEASSHDPLVLAPSQEVTATWQDDRQATVLQNQIGFLGEFFNKKQLRQVE